MKRLIISILLLLLLISVLAAGCTSDLDLESYTGLKGVKISERLESHAAAIENAIDGYECKYFDISNLREQLQAQISGDNITENSVVYSLKIELIDLSAIDENILKYETPSIDFNAPDTASFTDALRSAFIEGVSLYITENDLQKVSEDFFIDITVTDSNGSWNGSISNSSISMLESKTNTMLDDVFMRIMDKEQDIYLMLIIAEQKNDIFKYIFDSFDYAEKVTIEDIEITSETTCLMTITYPNPEEVYGTLALRAIEEYNSPLFGSINIRLNSEDYFNRSAGEPTYYTRVVEVIWGFDPEPNFAQLTGSLQDELIYEIEGARNRAKQEAEQVISERWLVLPVDTPRSGVLTGQSQGHEIRIRTSSDLGNYYLMFYEIPGTDYTANGVLKLTAFVRGGERLTVRLPSGNYKLVYGIGDTWYGEQYMFGPEGNYSRFDSVLNSQRGYYLTLTLYFVEGGNTGLTPLPYPGR